MAQMAQRWLDGRQKREVELRKMEDDETFEGQQTFFRVSAKLAHEGRLSRFAFQAMRK